MLQQSGRHSSIVNWKKILISYSMAHSISHNMQKRLIRLKKPSTNSRPSPKSVPSRIPRLTAGQQSILNRRLDPRKEGQKPLQYIPDLFPARKTPRRPPKSTSLRHRRPRKNPLPGVGSFNRGTKSYDRGHRIWKVGSSHML